MNSSRLMRARITDRLARATRFPVTLIVAPAGFGKSIALRDFIETSRLDAVRYDVRREDATLLTFARGLSQALEPLVPAALAAFPTMQQRTFGAQDPVRELSDWFAEHLKRTVCTIVVDDLHYASVDSATVKLLADLIERTTERINWIIASRSDGGLPVASWMGYGRMDLPVGEEDLRFTAQEAFAAAEEAQTGLPATEIELLRDLTGGWPVALAIALRTRTHAADLLRASTGTRDLIYRYLAEQVFGGLSESQRDLLLATCVLPVFDARMAEALVGNGDDLAILRRNVAFMTAAGDDYRYHDLFRDFLESQLRMKGDRVYKRALARAAAILEKRRESAGALTLYIKAADEKAVLRVLETSGFALVERGQAEVVAKALDTLPDEMRVAHASPLGLRATLDAARGYFDLAEPNFIAAIARSQDDPELNVEIIARYALHLVRNGRDCVSLLAPFTNDDATPARLRVQMLGTLATSYEAGENQAEASRAIQKALKLADAGIDDDSRARIYQQAAYVYQFGAARDEAKRFANLAVELALQRNLYEVAARAFSVLYSIEYGENDDPIASLKILDKLDECARKSGSRQTLLFGLIAMHEIEAERGNDVALDELDRELAADQTLLPGPRAQSLLAAHALRAAWEGDFARAHALLAGTAPGLPTQERRALRLAEIALYASAAGLAVPAEDGIREAIETLGRCTGASRRTTRARLVLALAELARGHSSAAHRHVTEAERAPQTPRVKAFAHAVRALYRRTLGEGEEAALAAALERLRADQLGGIARLIESIPMEGGGAPAYALLTAAERQILQLLAQGSSSKAVAMQTGRSPQTVDTHIRAICRKFNCSGRREAVALAVGQGWVQA